MLVEMNRNPNQYAIQEQLEPGKEQGNWKRESGGKREKVGQIMSRKGERSSRGWGTESRSERWGQQREVGTEMKESQAPDP